MIYNIPTIKLNNRISKLDNKCLVEYDLFKGALLINKENVNRIVMKEKELVLLTF